MLVTHPLNCQVQYSFTKILFSLMYVLKIEGKVKIPDYVQIRDEEFTLLAYFRADRPEGALAKIGLADKEEQLKKIIAELPYGKIQKIDL